MLKLLHPRRWSLAVMAVAIILALAIVGVVAERAARARQPLDERAEAMASRGDPVGAEALYWAAIDRGPITVPLVVALLENHARLGAPRLEMSEDGEELKVRAPAASPDDARVEALLAGDRLPADVAPLARWWSKVVHRAATDEDRAPVLAAADAEPPAPWANHLLAREALLTARIDDAAARYDKEGLRFGAAGDDREEDVERALDLWMGADAWDEVGKRLRDPRYDRFVDATTRMRYALHTRDWRGAIRWFVPANVSHATAGVYALAGVAALLWFWFCARVGHLGERPKLRLPLYAGAFVLGVASIFLTVAFIFVEEEFLHFREKKNAIADLIYFVLGVGLREEISKLAFFAPLIPIIRKFKGGTREVLACGALVGLGFAAEENVGYFGGGSLTVALARFLTANFFHMSTAAISAMALYEFVIDREKHAQTLSRALFTVIAIHGLYDFFISNHDVAKWSFLSMVSLVLLARQFLSLVRGLRGERGGRAHGVPLLTRFVLSVAVLTGASFVYASFVAGPALAARAMAEGLLGEAILVYFFVQELETI